MMPRVMSELPKAYEPKHVEQKWQQRWLNDGCFHADPHSNKPAYSIVIPPPNVTGVLHIGHVLNNTIQDILARRARQEGKEVLWLPGTDHAGIATQARVEKELAKENPPRTRFDVGREEFVKMVWDWKEEHGGIIINQLKKLGCSCDWERERFTMDSSYAPEVARAFTELFREGLIYRGLKMVNWDPVLLTALSDEEVIMTPSKSKLYTIRYRLENDPEHYLLVATTRPETIMADVAVAVNPNDPRMAKWVGKRVMRPLVETPIPVIADEHVEIGFGTGALKITPAHDRVDFEVGVKFGLEIIDVLTPDGHINCPACPELHGMDRFEARDKSIELIRDKGLLEKEEAYENNVGVSQRSDVPIEPRLSMQWFLRYPCVQEAADAVEKGDITFRPAHWGKTYAHWLEGIRDWCISRQLWWGHRIPVWYRKDLAEELKQATKLDVQDADAGRIYVGPEPPTDAENWVQDEDALDTWFSSWLWPFATMDAECRAKFYPTTDLVTGPDIIFFWVARMIMAGYRFAGGKPFANVFFTSIVRDLLGRKMSKSLGNSPDPLDLISRYGADGLRFGLMRIAPTGTDVKFDEKQIEEGKNFANKLYNAVRFRLMQGETSTEPAPHFSAVHLDILAKLRDLHAQVTEALSKYEFNAYTQSLYSFFWNEYCSLFLEAVKGDLREGADPSARNATLATIDTVLRHYLALLSPIMPHITEELWESLGFAARHEGKPLMLTELPKAESLLPGLEEEDISKARIIAAALYDAANRVRNLKAEYNLATNKNVHLVLKPALPFGDDIAARLALLAGADGTTIDPVYTAPKGTPSTLSPLGEIFMPLEGLVDVDAEKTRISRGLEKISVEIKRSQAKLSNESFVQRAPADVVQQEKERLAEWLSKKNHLETMLAALG